MNYYTDYKKISDLLLLLQLVSVVTLTLILIINSRQKKSNVKIGIVEYDYYNNARATVTNDLNNINALVMYAFNKKGVVAVGVEIDGQEIAFYTDIKQVKDGKIKWGKKIYV